MRMALNVRPESRDKPSNDENHVSDRRVEESVELLRLNGSRRCASVPDGAENDRRVQTEAVDGDVDGEPTP
jgi:hypothetical protein